tara:strand:+ start:105 stop:491 length:387 start_codon:yes stop_codon:yes gene_type:complete
MKRDEDHLDILRKVGSNPDISQRELSQQLGFSLGKLNYCLNALKAKGLVKIKNFKKNPNKLVYAYILTPQGISEKTKLTLNFMNRKLKEYDELKRELEKNKLKLPSETLRKVVKIDEEDPTVLIRKGR